MSAVACFGDPNCISVPFIAACPPFRPSGGVHEAHAASAYRKLWLRVSAHSAATAAMTSRSFQSSSPYAAFNFSQSAIAGPESGAQFYQALVLPPFTTAVTVWIALPPDDAKQPPCPVEAVQTPTPAQWPETVGSSSLAARRDAAHSLSSCAALRWHRSPRISRDSRTAKTSCSIARPRPHRHGEFRLFQGRSSRPQSSRQPFTAAVRSSPSKSLDPGCRSTAIDDVRIERRSAARCRFRNTPACCNRRCFMLALPINSSALHC